MKGPIKLMWRFLFIFQLNKHMQNLYCNWLDLVFCHCCSPSYWLTSVWMFLLKQKDERLWRCVGKVGMVDIVCFLARDESLVNLSSALKTPLASLVGESAFAVRHVDSQTKCVIISSLCIQFMAIGSANTKDILFANVCRILISAENKSESTFSFSFYPSLQFLSSSVSPKSFNKLIQQGITTECWYTKYSTCKLVSKSEVIEIDQHIWMTWTDKQ